jgi:hypothetical protein
MIERMETARILGVSGSLRSASFSTAILELSGAEMEISGEALSQGRSANQQSLAVIATGLGQLREENLSQRALA